MQNNVIRNYYYRNFGYLLVLYSEPSEVSFDIYIYDVVEKNKQDY